MISSFDLLHDAQICVDHLIDAKQGMDVFDMRPWFTIKDGWAERDEKPD